MGLRVACAEFGILRPRGLGSRQTKGHRPI